MKHHRLVIAAAALLVLGFFPGSAVAEENEDRQALEEELADLVRRAGELEVNQRAQLVRDIRAYMARTGRYRGLGKSPGAEEDLGGALVLIEGLTVTASATAVALGTLNLDPGNRTLTNGDLDLFFNFDVSENVDFFINLRATADGNYPDAFSPANQNRVDFTTGAPGLFPSTLSGLSDGIGIDGTAGTSNDSLDVDEAAFRLRRPMGGALEFEAMAGALDPRNYFAQNAFAHNENTQFLNNVFRDPPAITWPSTAASRPGGVIYGFILSAIGGDEGRWRFDIGHFNAPGRFFDQGFVMAQITRTGTILGREAHIRLYGQWDQVPDSAGVGISVDLWLTEKAGFFVRATFRENKRFAVGDTNPIESDWSAGFLFRGLVPSRPQDTIGIAGAMMKGNVSDFRNEFTLVTGNTEGVVELFYRAVCLDNTLQISPMAQLIIDPGARSFTERNLLVVIGLRIHIPF